MADKEEVKVTREQKKSQIIEDAPKEGEENVGEVSDVEKEIAKKEKKPRAEFQPLDLGNEDNVSDWLVNMLSGRLWDFAINNLEWAGDLCDRAFFSRLERNAEKRQQALQVKEAKKRAAESSKKALTNEDGSINVGASKTREYDDKGNLIKIDDYEVQPKDKLVDAEGKPLQGKTLKEIEAQLLQSHKNIAEKENNSKPMERVPSKDEKPKKRQKANDGKKKEGKKKDGKDTKKKQPREQKKTKGEKNADGQKKTRARRKRSPQEAAREAENNRKKRQDYAKKGRTVSNKARGTKQKMRDTQSSKNKILNLSRQNQQNQTRTNTRGRSGKQGGRE